MGTEAQSDAVQPPKHLYKYLDRCGLDALLNLELKITPPNEFADPLEFTPVLNQTDAEKEAARQRYGIVCTKANADDCMRSEFKDAVSQNGVRVL